MFRFYTWLMYKRCICFAFTTSACLCTGNTGHGQNNDYQFENITSAQGLAERLVNTIIQDVQGFMWFGSSEGLTKYDGYNCAVYRHKTNDRHSLSDNEVHTLCIDKDGTLWIGTHKGLNRYDVQNNRFDVFLHDSTDDNSIGGNEIFSLATDEAGNLWIGTIDGGLDMMVRHKINNAQPSYRFIHYRHSITDSNTISDNRVLSIVVDKYNNPWIGTMNGLNVLNTKEGKFERLYKSKVSKSSISNNVVSKIYKDFDGAIWLCGNAMLDKVDVNVFFEQKRFLVQHYLESEIFSHRQNNWVFNDFLIDNEHKHVWVATNDNGLLKCAIDKNGQLSSGLQFLHNGDNSYSLVNSVIYSLYADRSGVIWIGTAKGVSKYVASKERFNEAANLSPLLPKHKNFVMALLADQENRLWIGYDDDTLILITGKNTQTPSVRNMVLSPLLKGDQINTIFQSRQGDIYIGTLLKGVFVIPKSLDDLGNQTRWVHIDTKQYPLLPSNNIYALAEDSGGMVWIGTYTGLCKYDPSNKMVEPVFVSPQNKIQADYIIRATAVDRHDRIWCATDNGIYCIGNKKVLHAFKNNDHDSNSVSNNRITSLIIDHAENIWAGTRDGLNRYDISKKKFYRFTTQDGLSSAGIRSIKQDENNNLWIATDHGLSKYEIDRKQFHTYGAADGLYADQFIANAVTADINGRFYFGTNNGLVSFTPSNISPNTFTPPVVITDIRILNTPIALFKDTTIYCRYRNEGKLVLNYNQNFFSFDFAALNYINTEANRYTYKLEGIDKGWSPVGNQRSAGYTDIKPGTYTFKVKGSNNDGVWNETPTSITVIITPPWWQTWWFYALCAVTVCAIGYLIYRIRLQQILKLYKLRSNIAKDLHDDVGSALSSIALLSQVAREGKTNSQLKPAEIFTRIGDTSKQMIDLMDDIVWSVNPDNDRFANMLVRMREYAAEMLEAKNIAFTFKLSAQTDGLKIPMQMRKDYFLIFKEAINNLAKYSNATEAIIIIERNGHELITRIGDNGKGFDCSAIYAGNGLQNMQSRARNLRGKLSIESAKENGTCVTLIMPVT